MTDFKRGDLVSPAWNSALIGIGYIIKCNGNYLRIQWVDGEYDYAITTYMPEEIELITSILRETNENN